MEKFYSRYIKVIIPVIGVLIVFTVFLLVKVFKTDSDKKYVAEIPDVSYSKVVATTGKKNDYDLFAPSVTQTQPAETQSGTNAVTQYVQQQPQAQIPVITQTAPAVQGDQSNSPLSWNTGKIISELSSAINKTKALKNGFNVHHTESFTANITECTGGSIGKLVANKLMGYIVKPIDETLSFSNGSAVNSEGETIQILLPKNGEFSLSESGVKSATAYKQGAYTVINVKLVREDCGMYDVPRYNSTSVGYLNVANYDLLGMSVTDAQINYLGSSITVKIADDGYVKYAEYSIPLHVYGKAAKGSLSGEATFDGEQKETWEF